MEEKFNQNTFRICCPLHQKEPIFFKENTQTSLDSVISFSATLTSGKTFSIHFQSLEGTIPKDFGYFVALWQGNQIEELSDAINIQKINTTTQDGNFNFKNLYLNNKTYTIGLGVSLKDSTTISATVVIPKNANLFDTFKATPTTLKVSYYGTNSLIAKFKTAEYNLPFQNKNWIALFKGEFTANFFDGINYIFSTRINKRTNKGSVSMNDIPNGLEINEIYTLVYGMGVHANGSINFRTIVASTQFKTVR